MSNFLWILLHPSYWLVTGIGIYSEQLDASLNKLLDDNTPFEVIDGYYVKFGGYVLWYQNHPYASFSTRLELELSNGTFIGGTRFPSRRTKASMMAALLKQEPLLAEII